MLTSVNPDNNMFGSLPPFAGVLILWESNGSTVERLSNFRTLSPSEKPTQFLMAHKTCTVILCKVFGVPGSLTGLNREQLRAICEIEAVLGRCKPGVKGGIGRIPYVDYETASGVHMWGYWDKPVWEGQITFDWKRFKEWGPIWVLSRLDIFPKFFSKVTPERLTSLG